MSSEEEEILKALANLQLPHMPQNLSLDGANETTATPQKERQAQSPSLPSIRILVVADIDLPSAAALAEYCLQQRNTLFDASRIDLCIACGPFCRDEDVLTYLRGKHRLRKLKPCSPPVHYHHDTTSASNHHQHSQFPTPFSRNKEETAGLEGLLTASLSQLESIVCRVVYCPGTSDPITSMVPPTSHSTRQQQDTSRRLTPNSRNIHKQWLPLAPSLGCAGLVYLESTDVALGKRFSRRQHRRRSSDRSSTDGEIGPHLSDLSEDDDGGTEDEMEYMVDTLINAQESSRGYVPTLKRLLQLAPPPHKKNMFASPQSQSILVTHYIDYNSASQDETVNGSPSWAVETPSPWPYGHDDFCDATPTQQLLCLEIASGSSALRKAEVKQRGNVQILFPGSLRTRGEFCIVDLSVQPTPEPSTSAEGVHEKRLFSWQVTNVDFYNLNHKP